MNLNQTILQNLYAELNLALSGFDILEEKYHTGVARINLLNVEIARQKKLIADEKLVKDERK